MKIYFNNISSKIDSKYGNDGGRIISRNIILNIEILVVTEKNEPITLIKIIKIKL